MMQNIYRYAVLAGVALLAAMFGFIARAHAQLIVYEPFNYTVGANLGGTDPDGAGPTAGSPTLGQTGTYAAGGGGGSYKWRAWHGQQLPIAQ